ncbi:MAG: SDR family oxidoreductase, partial [Bacteroidetes bacterium]
STAGIGLAIAQSLAREGVEVILHGRTRARLEAAMAHIRAELPGARLSGLTADFGEKEAVEALTTRLGTVDILVNNVGIFASQTFAETSDADWQRMFEVNVMSGVRLSRALLPGMLARNWGRILFISSECAHLVPEDLIAYGTTKAALLALSRGLAQTTAGTQVTVNAVLPGSTRSEGAARFLQEAAAAAGTTEAVIAEQFFREVRTTSLLQRFATPEEVASMVTFLASPLAVATNGAAVKVEGGSVPGIG